MRIPEHLHALFVTVARVRHSVHFRRPAADALLRAVKPGFHIMYYLIKRCPMLGLAETLCLSLLRTVKAGFYIKYYFQ